MPEGGNPQLQVPGPKSHVQSVKAVLVAPANADADAVGRIPRPFEPLAAHGQFLRAAGNPRPQRWPLKIKQPLPAARASQTGLAGRA